MTLGKEQKKETLLATEELLKENGGESKFIKVITEEIANLLNILYCTSVGFLLAFICSIIHVILLL